MRWSSPKVVACGETGVRNEGSNAYQWVFRPADAVVHRAALTRGAVVVRETMEGHRPEVWCSDRYSAQQGHGEEHQTCLAHLARDVALGLRGERGHPAIAAAAFAETSLRRGQRHRYLGGLDDRRQAPRPGAKSRRYLVDADRLRSGP
ncbi:transposase [Jiella sp. 40Bstr34]|uniref:Transposase n=1 Tax=Jiella pacifica TaxID=2696469 RepID=A0A6N9TCS3_9HYPH|nr:transposase [Jiella pacifica]